MLTKALYLYEEDGALLYLNTMKNVLHGHIFPLALPLFF